jgi:hypothetical protein
LYARLFLAFRIEHQVMLDVTNAFVEALVTEAAISGRSATLASCGAAWSVRGVDLPFEPNFRRRGTERGRSRSGVVRGRGV